jgi:hypothetical protein
MISAAKRCPASVQWPSYWITGRVDSLPALFYLSSFLAFARWRTTGAAWLYGVSVGLFFLALFSKQMAITMLATLVLYDALVERRPVCCSWPRLRAYAPFAVLTAGYVAQRYFLFGNAIRENVVSARTFAELGAFQATQLQIFVLGSRRIQHDVMDLLAWAAIGVTLMLVIVELCRPSRTVVGATGARLLFFGPVWWLLSTAPLLVTYPATRHLCLASVAVAITAGLGFEALWDARCRRRRYAPVLGAAALLLACVLRLQAAVGEWNTAARISEKITRDVERQAAAAPPGSLLVLGAPHEGANGLTFPLLWSWASPFAHQPPFARTAAAEHVLAIVPPQVYCCNEQWLADMRGRVRAWSEATEPRPVVALVWDNSSGELVRQSDAENPSLRTQALGLSGARTRREACSQLNVLLRAAGSQLDHCRSHGAEFYLGTLSR